MPFEDPKNGHEIFERGKRIPLRDRSRVIAYARVDKKDYEKVSKLSWYLSDSGYATTGLWINGKTKQMKMQRMLLSVPKGMEVDHINKNKLDNRRGNLRVCTRSENLMNRGKYKCNKTGYKGVHWDKSKKKYVAQIRVKNVHYFLGRFDSKIKAFHAYVRGQRKYHNPKFASI